MRKEFTMRCNEEDFQSVLPALDQYGIDYSEVKLDNDKCFVMFNPFSNSIKSISSKVAIGLVKEVIFFDRFHFNTFIGRISGLYWLELQNQTIDDLKEKKPYPASMEDMFQDEHHGKPQKEGQILGCDARIVELDSDGIEPVKLKDDQNHQVITYAKSEDEFPVKGYVADGYNPKTFEDFAKKWFGASDPIEERKHTLSVRNEDGTVKAFPTKDEDGFAIHYAAIADHFKNTSFLEVKEPTEFHVSFFPKKESPISSGINISAGNAALAYMEFKKLHPSIEPFCIHDKSQL